jgi:dienelactone hydrolase
VLTGILREGAQRILAEAIDAEVAEWIDAHPERIGVCGASAGGHLSLMQGTAGSFPRSMRTFNR